MFTYLFPAGDWTGIGCVGPQIPLLGSAPTHQEVATADQWRVTLVSSELVEQLSQRCWWRHWSIMSASRHWDSAKEIYKWRWSLEEKLPNCTRNITIAHEYEYLMRSKVHVLFCFCEKIVLKWLINLMEDKYYSWDEFLSSALLLKMMIGANEYFEICRARRRKTFSRN